MSPYVPLPRMCAGDHLKAGGIANKFVQGVDDLRELRSQVSFFHPAVQHKLMQGSRAVHGWGQSVVLLDCVDHLLIKK